MKKRRKPPSTREGRAGKSCYVTGQITSKMGETSILFLFDYVSLDYDEAIPRDKLVQQARVFSARPLQTT